MEISPTGLKHLSDDPRFEIVKNLDHAALINLCSTNLIFHDFCQRFEGYIYRYLLQRDYGIDNPMDTAKNRYMYAKNGLAQILSLLRAPNVDGFNYSMSIFTDMLELQNLAGTDHAISSIFGQSEKYSLIFPSNSAIWSLSDDVSIDVADFYVKFGTEMLYSHIGIFDPTTRMFTNLNNQSSILNLPPTRSASSVEFLNNPGFDLSYLGTVNNIDVIRVKHRLIVNSDQHSRIWQWVIAQEFEELDGPD